MFASYYQPLTVETLIVSSEQDYLTPLEEQVYLKEHIANSDHIIIKGAGHASMYERPGLFVSLVLGFVNKDNKKLHYLILICPNLTL